MNADKSKAPVVYYYQGFSFKKYQSITLKFYKFCSNSIQVTFDF
jgi:hypothetical protein